jgi:Hydrazine synthase alpha subunit middle domain
MKHGFITRLFSLLGLLLSTIIISGQTIHNVSSVSFPDFVFVQTPQYVPGPLPARFPQGSRIVRLAKDRKAPVDLTGDFFAAADPQASFDGSKILFAGKTVAAAKWQIWEMRADGSAKRRVSNLDMDCLKPFYLPRGPIAWTAFARVGKEPSRIYVSEQDGTQPYPITFGPGNFQLETVLASGRLLVSADTPLLPQPGAQSARLLYTLRPDGTGLSSFRCDHQPGVQRSQAVELTDGSVVFVKSTPHVEGSELAMVAAGAIHNALITPPGSWDATPHEFRQQELVIARRTSPSAHFDLYTYDTSARKLGSEIYRDSRVSSLDAIPLAAHEPPRWYWSTLNSNSKDGYFICLDARRSGSVPGGVLAANVSAVRVLALDSATGKESSLGEAPVEKDGSFYIALPADVPVRFQLLDTAQQIIREQRGWIWTRPNEEHGCVGCHESKALAPENRWPLTLQRLDMPARLGLPSEPQAAH